MSAPKKIKCQKRNIENEDGYTYLTCFIPDTEIMVPLQLSSILYPLADVIDDPGNPRKTKNIKVLQDSIQRFGMRWPILVNERTMIIEAGHKRKEALRNLGVNYAPVVFVSDSDTTAKAFNVADNRVGEIVSDWDEGALREIYESLRDEDALIGVGLDDVSMEEISLKLLEETGGGSNENGGGGEEPPDEFKKYGEDIDTEHECPKCGFKWSGKQNSKKENKAGDE